MIKAVDNKYENEFYLLYGYWPRFSLVWLGYTPSPDAVSDEESDCNRYEMASDDSKKSGGNDGNVEEKKWKGRKVGYKLCRGSKENKE